MSENIEKFIGISIPVLDGFSRVEPRRWGRRGIFLELEVEIGSLGRALTIWEEYRHGKKSRHMLSDELSDILFVLIKLMREENIVITDVIEPEHYLPEDGFFQLMELTENIRQKAVSPQAYAISPKTIREMLAVLFGTAHHYGIDLYLAHVREMNLARLWQTLFFDAHGKKKSWRFFRKIFWKFAVYRHEHIADAK